MSPTDRLAALLAEHVRTNETAEANAARLLAAGVTLAPADDARSASVIRTLERQLLDCQNNLDVALSRPAPDTALREAAEAVAVALVDRGLVRMYESEATALRAALAATEGE